MMNASPLTVTGDRHRARLLLALWVAGAIGAVLGAYIDWVWWPVYEGIVLTLGAVALVPVGAILALVGRGIVRRGGFVLVVLGVGLLAGQSLGPSREPLIFTDGGTMTLSLESPVVAESTGRADCATVASATEFRVDGSPILDIADGDRVVDLVAISLGDRWDQGPGHDGITLWISVTDRKVPDTGPPVVVLMAATESSLLEANMSKHGGTIRFASLARQEQDGYAPGAPIDLAGTIEWTCGVEIPEGLGG